MKSGESLSFWKQAKEYIVTVPAEKAAGPFRAFRKAVSEEMERSELRSSSFGRPHCPG
jgi:hypothetical protein